MKITCEVDCTPAEARQFFGLPNVEPLQDAVMRELEKKMLADMERFSPESIMKAWFSLVPQSAAQLQEMFSAMISQGMGGKSAKSRHSS